MSGEPRFYSTSPWGAFGGPTTTRSCRAGSRSAGWRPMGSCCSRSPPEPGAGSGCRTAPRRWRSVPTALGSSCTCQGRLPSGTFPDSSRSGARPTPSPSARRWAGPRTVPSSPSLTRVRARSYSTRTGENQSDRRGPFGAGLAGNVFPSLTTASPGEHIRGRSFPSPLDTTAPVESLRRALDAGGSASRWIRAVRPESRRCLSSGPGLAREAFEGLRRWRGPAPAPRSPCPATGAGRCVPRAGRAASPSGSPRGDPVVGTMVRVVTASVLQESVGRGRPSVTALARSATLAGTRAAASRHRRFRAPTAEVARDVLFGRIRGLTAPLRLASPPRCCRPSAGPD